MTPMAAKTVRAEHVGETRERILAAAERLFAERGVYAVSNRQVSEAAGQGNNAAVGYHFGTKIDLVRAIALKHTAAVEEVRARMVAELRDSPQIADWASCMVRPTIDHLEALGSPSWYARFIAQVMTDPALQDVIADQADASPALLETIEGFTNCLPELPADVQAERAVMSRQLIIHMSAERERALAAHLPTPRSSWHDAATGLIDVLVALWQAPVTPRG
ncbi:TetR/AcrR family transcriptional regulator [Pengzhenrongella sp.]|uniref:TetR/AcrR family transcriptional regulator n=1 Tax=Pengzhenrongella sp. TaxID=2888820 RepID=UPI002F930D05